MLAFLKFAVTKITDWYVFAKFAQKLILKCLISLPIPNLLNG